VNGAFQIATLGFLLMGQVHRPYVHAAWLRGSDHVVVAGGLFHAVGGRRCLGFWRGMLGLGEWATSAAIKSPWRVVPEEGWAFATGIFNAGIMSPHGGAARVRLDGNSFQLAARL